MSSEQVNDTALNISVEELPEEAVNVSDCLSTASSIGTAGSCAATIACAGSIIYVY
jgi:hypothetical protein